ncbi:MAG: cupin domain-containing protein [Treponema sp.]|jgi:predicted cupin superfamily sugar epimerase|nr:cupin domain-containing protein [Treponema sp.]
MLFSDEQKYWVETLELKPHTEGGWYREVWRGGLEIPFSVLPGYGGSRPASSLIYYLLRHRDLSAWHKLKSTEIWTWHAGGVLEQSLGGTGESPAEDSVRLIGSHPENGESFNAVIPPNTWQTTSVLTGDFVLVSCIVSPAYKSSDLSFPPEW